MKTTILKRRTPEGALLIRHNNKVKTISLWAKHYDVPRVTMTKWIRDRGVETAFERAIARQAQPVKEKPAEPNPNWSAPLPIFDHNQENKNRLRAWMKRFTPDEIAVKAKMMRLA